MMANGKRGQGDQILNLCFHGIGTPGRVLEPEEELYWMEEAHFEDLLEVISKYPSIRITFDDSNASDATQALPALRRLSLEATFFVIAGRLDRAGSLASSDVRSLVQEGMTVGSHGMQHVSWRSATDQVLQEELAGAAEAIAEAAGRPVRQVACPFGSYDRRVLNAIRRHGFSRVYTVDGGSARRDAWLQSRHTIRTNDTPADIERLARSPRGSVLPAMVRRGKSFVKRCR
jgi:peptidoglycan/xylan/chitin deacetylase (PgdA/CDA1 family)